MAAKIDGGLVGNPALWPQAVLDEVTDPVSLELLEDPVELNCNQAGYGGHIVSKKTVDKLTNCPICKHEIDSSLVKPNYFAARMVAALVGESRGVEHLARINQIIHERLNLSTDVWKYPLGQSSFKLEREETCEGYVNFNFSNISENKSGVERYTFGYQTTWREASLFFYSSESCQLIIDEISKHFPDEIKSDKILIHDNRKYNNCILLRFYVAEPFYMFINYIVKNNLFVDEQSQVAFARAIKLIEEFKLENYDENIQSAKSL